MPPAVMTVDSDATRIAGHELFRGDLDELIAALARLVGEPGSQLVVTPNVDQVLMAATDERAADAFARASLLLADGAPLVGLARMLGDDGLRRHTGADLIQLVCATARERGWRVAIAGGAPAIADEAARRLAEDHPGVFVRSVHTPFLESIDDPAGAVAVAGLRELQPDVVFLCFGFPRQEAWWAHWRDQLPAALYVGAGAAVDFAAGAKARAPQAIQRMGLEWTWRLAQEPRRLAHRYLVRGPRFLATVVRSVLHARRARTA